ncbi:AAA family ATPase [Paenarthrobacter sp. Z7-10]|uniref:AAA family ATPase n=1 Tax=Paenarthrobacter sp. Z7-10 TaxID=2787635 RepID=UPI003FA7DE27
MRLIIVAGLPGTGKTTLARPLSERLAACYLRVDAIETAIARTRGPVSGPEGYAVA